MSNQFKFTILGCGSSGGVPRLGGNWGSCDPNNHKNTRTRCSLLVERLSAQGKTRLLIDTSPDMRAQLLRENIDGLDAVMYTHEHADHLHGLDDLRMIVINRRKMLPVYAAPRTKLSILDRFGYAFETPKGSSYPPILEMNDLKKKNIIEGNGGPIEFECFDVEHGNISASAIKINNTLYTPDISSLIGIDTNHLKDLDMWILDALRLVDHPSHFSLTDAMSAITAHSPNQAILTNMHIDLDYEKTLKDTPDNVLPAFDGLNFLQDIHAR